MRRRVLIALLVLAVLLLALGGWAVGHRQSNPSERSSIR